MSAHKVNVHMCYHVHARKRYGCNQRFSGCLRQKVGESDYAMISSWSASAGYLTSMLTKGAKVDSSSTSQL